MVSPRARSAGDSFSLCDQLIAAAGAVAPAAILVCTGEPEPEQIALGLRHPRASLLVLQQRLRQRLSARFTGKIPDYVT